MRLIRPNRNPSLRLTRQIPNVEKLRVREAREFKGGLNTFDTPLNLSTRFVIECRNLYPDTNGRLRLRYGTSLFANLTDMLDEIIAMEYYNTAIIAVGKNGKIASINASGVATLRWDATIADNSVAPSGNNSPSGWSTGLTFASFTQFAGDLIICNGVDKPLRMQPNYACTYLYDAGTASNVHVPIAKFCTTCNNYLILANTPTDKTTLYIGMKAVAGTFVGDPGVDNDAVNFITNTYVNRGSPDITGIAAFRDVLMVSFNETLLAIKLGIYETSGTHPAHIPDVEDVIENYGSISHRCLVPLGDDILFLDQAGMAGVQRATLTAKLSPTRESTLIGADLQQTLAPFTQAQLEQYVFAIHDRIAQHIMFFVPKSDVVTTSTDNNVFVYCFDRLQKFNAWSYFDNMPYRCGTRTTEGRIFLANAAIIYRYHNEYEPLYNDGATLSLQNWSDDTTWDDSTKWSETVPSVGTPIPFVFSLPWSDLQSTMHIKQSRYISVQAEGEAQYTLQMFIDGFSNPEMSMTFTETNTPATPNQAIRPSNNAQLYAWPQKFEKMRMRIEGSANNYIGFVSIQIAYLVGSIRR